eukprot:6006702-Pleurochrysis_carterae.AAC.4
MSWSPKSASKLSPGPKCAGTSTVHRMGGHDSRGAGASTKTSNGGSPSAGSWASSGTATSIVTSPTRAAKEPPARIPCGTGTAYCMSCGGEGVSTSSCNGAPLRRGADSDVCDLATTQPPAVCASIELVAAFVGDEESSVETQGPACVAACTVVASSEASRATPAENFESFCGSAELGTSAAGASPGAQASEPCSPLHLPAPKQRLPVQRPTSRHRLHRRQCFEHLEQARLGRVRAQRVRCANARRAQRRRRWRRAAAATSRAWRAAPRAMLRARNAAAAAPAAAAEAATAPCAADALSRPRRTCPPCCRRHMPTHLSRHHAPCTRRRRWAGLARR